MPARIHVHFVAARLQATPRLPYPLNVARGFVFACVCNTYLYMYITFYCRCRNVGSDSSFIYSKFRKCTMEVNIRYLNEYYTCSCNVFQRQGCIHGEELPYIFGAPLVGGFMHFVRNYTKSEMLLAEATMIYWSNFARTGNPNEPQETEPVHGVRQDRNRFKNIEWTAYEAVHKKYLNLGT